MHGGRTHLVMLLLLAVAPWALGLFVAAQTTDFPSLDGSGHNKDYPDWGTVDTPYIRHLPNASAYNGTPALTGANRPSPRAITLALSRTPYFKEAGRYNSSYLLTALGQLIAHDIARGGSTQKPEPIPIPAGDPAFSRFSPLQKPLLQESRQLLSYNRSEAQTAAGGGLEQVNTATAWLDASVLYGQDPNISSIIRAGTAGLLLDDGNLLLPLNRDRLTGAPLTKMKNFANRVPQEQLRLSANPAVNQNPLILSLVTLLMREHNTRARLVQAQHPLWGDEQIFQEARQWVIAHFQQITLFEYMNQLGIPLPRYSGYNASINPGIDNFFATASYRYGHATINDVILRLKDDWTQHEHGHLTLLQSWFNPSEVLTAGIEPILRGLIAQPQAEVEPRWAQGVAGNMNGHSTVNGTDLPAINIQRGRDHGLPDYNTCRRLMGLAPAKTFNDISPDSDIATTLAKLYLNNVNNVDAYVGGMAEAHHLQAHVGELFFTSIYDQFFRLREGDWWYYENTQNGLFNDSEIAEIRNTTLRTLILRNTNITNLPDAIWQAAAPQSLMAGAAAAGGAQQGSGAVDAQLVHGAAQLQVSPSVDNDGWARVKVSAASSGWLGFAVAQSAASGMIGADMVVGRMVNGKPAVSCYSADSHVPPTERPIAFTSQRLKLISFQQGNGQVSLEFERPLAASDNAAGSVGLAQGQPAAFLVALGSSNNFASPADFHGQNKEVYSVPSLFESRAGSSGSSNPAATSASSAAITKRRAHGTLMALNFMLVMPLGALAARQLRSHWIRNTAIKASLFYVHIATQVAGVVIATVGFVLATRFFGMPYRQVMYGHGQLGVAIVVLVWSQLLMGIIRPSAVSGSRKRIAWDVCHTLLGRSAMMLGVINVILGVTIFNQLYGGKLTLWGGLCAASLLSITLLQYICDRQEKYAVLRADRQAARHSYGATSAPFDDKSGHGADDCHNVGASFKDVGGPVPHASGGSSSSSSRLKLSASMLHRHNQASATAAGPIVHGDAGAVGGGGFGNDVGTAGVDDDAAVMVPAAGPAVTGSRIRQQHVPAGPAAANGSASLPGFSHH